MIVVVNGEERAAPAGATALALLEMIGLPPGRVAVELNGRVLPRVDLMRVVLQERDRIEVVQFVGGG